MKRVNESLMLELFRRQSVNRVEVAGTLSDWELLAIMQHHGVATRLLDWTRSPLVALYFCVSNEIETRDGDGRSLCEDAEIIAWRCAKQDITRVLPTNPLKVTRPIRYIPRIVTSRLRVQTGLFSVQPDPQQDLKPGRAEDLVRIRIPYDRRRELKASLYRHGIHEAMLFPDLDGLARHINWLQTDSY